MLVYFNWGILLMLESRLFLDRSSGTSRDWAAGVAKIPYVYTVELRDGGSYGFLLPPNQILQTGVETWEGVKAMMDAIRHISSTRNTWTIIYVEFLPS